ncbi:MAG: hypothetical protein JXR65_01820 [Bacteroidales bacterium]|nr:hypothetical protein [Bacteroidales bacterium]
MKNCTFTTNHELYVLSYLPKLQQQAQIMQNIPSITNKTIIIEERWKI